MNIRISNTGTVGDRPNANNSNRLQAPSGPSRLTSAQPVADFISVQKSLNAFEASLNLTLGVAAPLGQAALGAGSTGTQSSVSIQATVPPSTTGIGGGTTGRYSSLTIKSIYGEPPANLDRSGLSGIIDKSGHNLSNQEIANFFDGNPTTREIEQMRQSLGLNEYQETRALTIWRGVSYAEPVWAPDGTSTTGGTFVG